MSTPNGRKDPQNFGTWLAAGIAAGYCGPAVCETHDGTPTTNDEDKQFEDGYDPCIYILRLYPVPATRDATRDAVEANHSPSVWRK